MSRNFPVLLHAGCFAALRELSAAQRRAFGRLAERLSHGDWSGGTRVKRLQGVGRPVFEARHDAGDRVLFTLGKSADASTGELRPHLQVWDLVPHDRVERRARGINTGADAEFVHWDEIESELISEPPPSPAATFAELEPLDPEAGAGVIELMLAPPGADALRPEDIVGGARWYVVPDSLLAREDEWQALAEQGADELELKLTAEQLAVVRAPGPALLTGSAGSGKTTIAVHRLYGACDGPGTRVLYLTYSPWLLDHARRLFEGLRATRGPTGSVPSFRTVHELHRDLIGPQAPPAERVAGFEEFARWHAANVRSGDPALAWEEIRSIVKGACLDPGRALLGRADYEVKGRKRAPLFAAERGALHDVARRWQAHLEAQGLKDEIDLCRAALGRVPRGGAFDFVLCDEAQDLAEIQIELLVTLLRSPRCEGLFLAGDPQQVINPSGFRWAEVRSALRDRLAAHGRPVPQLLSLTRNFRSVRGLVELAAEILALKRERTGRSDGDETESSSVAGPAPVLLEGTAAEILEAAAGFGPRCAIVTGNAAQRDDLQRRLQTTRVFTVAESKGLEFDVVVLWGVVAASALPWRRLLDATVALREDPSCRRALHHAYVAVTRARRQLAIHEPEGAPPAWTIPRFLARLDRAPASALDRLLQRAGNPSEWIAEAEYFRERGRHRQAAECYRRGGDARGERTSLAMHHEAVGDLGTAGRLWSELGEMERAAPCFERAGLFPEAASAWRSTGDATRAATCSARGHEAAREWKRAAEAWESLRLPEEAARCWGHANERKRQLRCLAQADADRGDHAGAARRLEEAGEVEASASAWRAAGREGDALRCEALALERGRRFAAAALAWAASGDEARAQRCRLEDAEASGRWADAARMRESLGELDAAWRLYKRAGRTADAARLGIEVDLAAGRNARAAAALEARGAYARAASAWGLAAKAGEKGSPDPPPLPKEALAPWNTLAVSRFARKRKVRVVHEPLTRALLCEARAAEEEGRFVDAASAWKRLKDPSQALRCEILALRQAGRHAEAAQVFLGRGALHAAAQCFEAAGDTRNVLACRAGIAETALRYEEAATLYAQAGATDDAERCREAARRAPAAAPRPVRVAARGTRRGPAPVVHEITAQVRALLDQGDIDGAIDVADSVHDMWLSATLRQHRAKLRAAPASAAAPPRARAPAGEAERLILEALKAESDLRNEDLQDRTPLPSAVVSATLQRLLRDGVITRSGKARGTRYALREHGGS